jgi:hypothetical protein
MDRTLGQTAVELAVDHAIVWRSLRLSPENEPAVDPIA